MRVFLLMMFISALSSSLNAQDHNSQNKHSEKHSELLDKYVIPQTGIKDWKFIGQCSFSNQKLKYTHYQFRPLQKKHRRIFESNYGLFEISDGKHKHIISGPEYVASIIGQDDCYVHQYGPFKVIPAISGRAPFTQYTHLFSAEFREPLSFIYNAIQNVPAIISEVEGGLVVSGQGICPYYRERQWDDAVCLYQGVGKWQRRAKFSEKYFGNKRAYPKLLSGKGNYGKYGLYYIDSGTLTYKSVAKRIYDEHLQLLSSHIEKMVIKIEPKGSMKLKRNDAINASLVFVGLMHDFPEHATKEQFIEFTKKIKSPWLIDHYENLLAYWDIVKAGY